MIRLNGHQVEPTMFSDQTSQVWQLPPVLFAKKSMINWDFTLEGEIMHLSQLVRLCRHMGVEHLELHMSYLPYARQDKEVSNETTFALKEFCWVIDNMGFDAIYVLDAHSDYFINHVRNSVNELPYHYVAQAIRDFDPYVVCFPDAGAATRYKGVSGKPFITAEKVRNQQTGQIISIKVNHDGYGVVGKKVLIIDDICDRGGTFIGLTKILKQMGCSSVGLYTTHGIYSGGVDIIKDSGIDEIYNKNGIVSGRKHLIMITPWKNE